MNHLELQLFESKINQEQLFIYLLTLLQTGEKEQLVFTKNAANKSQITRATLTKNYCTNKQQQLEQT